VDREASKPSTEIDALIEEQEQDRLLLSPADFKKKWPMADSDIVKFYRSLGSDEKFVVDWT